MKQFYLNRIQNSSARAERKTFHVYFIFSNSTWNWNKHCHDCLKIHNDGGCHQKVNAMKLVYSKPAKLVSYNRGCCFVIIDFVIIESLLPYRYNRVIITKFAYTELVITEIVKNEPDYSSNQIHWKLLNVITIMISNQASNVITLSVFDGFL